MSVFWWFAVGLNVVGLIYNIILRDVTMATVNLIAISACLLVTSKEAQS